MTNSTDDATVVVELLAVMKSDFESRCLVVTDYDTKTGRMAPSLNRTAGATGFLEPAGAMQPYLTNDLADSDVACACLFSVLPACVVQSLILRLRLRLMLSPRQSTLHHLYLPGLFHDDSSLQIYCLAPIVEEFE